MTNEYVWDDKDKVIDQTKRVKKIWDTIMPETYPYIKKFDTEGVKEVEHIQRMGPYHMTERKIKFKVEVTLDSKPLKEIGWSENEEISNEMITKAYGKDYFYEMRNSMRRLLSYVGLDKYSNFDFVGDIGGSVE